MAKEDSILERSNASNIQGQILTTCSCAKSASLTRWLQYCEKPVRFEATQVIWKVHFFFTLGGEHCLCFHCVSSADLLACTAGKICLGGIIVLTSQVGDVRHNVHCFQYARLPVPYFLYDISHLHTRQIRNECFSLFVTIFVTQQNSAAKVLVSTQHTAPYFLHTDKQRRYLTSTEIV